jgi:hypothetical protein
LPIRPLPISRLPIRPLPDFPIADKPLPDFPIADQAIARFPDCRSGHCPISRLPMAITRFPLPIADLDCRLPMSLPLPDFLITHCR